MPAMIIVVIFIVAAWDVTKTAVKGQHADYQASRPAKKQGKPGKGSPAGPKTAGPKQPSRARHAAGYWTGEAVHGFPVFRNGWWSGWLAHQTARNQQRSVREQARTTHLQGLADHLRILREQRELQRQAHEDIQRTLDDAPQPPKGRKEVREAAGKVLPFPVRKAAADAPLPSETVGKPPPGPYARPADDGAAHLKAPMPGPRLNDRQRDRDADPRLRNACAGCGRQGSADDPLVVVPEGWRVHDSHVKDPASGYYVPGVWPKGVPHRRNGDAPSPATNGGSMPTGTSADTTYDTVVADAKAAHAQSDEDTSTIQKRMDDAYAQADAMTAVNVDSAVIDEQMSYADSLKEALKALTDAGEHAGNTAQQAQRYHGGVDEAVKSAPGRIADKEFHTGG